MAKESLWHTHDHISIHSQIHTGPKALAPSSINRNIYMGTQTHTEAHTYTQQFSQAQRLSGWCVGPDTGMWCCGQHGLL